MIPEDVPYFDKEILKLYRLRWILSRAWQPLCISKDEAVDILLWAVGKDVAQLHFSLWPERIRERTGVKFKNDEPLLKIFQKVAVQWKKTHPLVNYSKN